MVKNTAISLGDCFEAFVRRNVESGDFATISEVIRDALRRADGREKRNAALDAALQEGLASGPGEAFDFESFLRETHTTCRVD